jgi:UDP-3-O-[3-hydroxymyristoyl] glucosamine N-acyltransferase
VALLVSETPRMSFMQLVAHHFPPRRPLAGIHPTACVDPSSVVDPTASIGAFCYIGPDCTIGADTILHQHVTLCENVRIGRNVVIHGGTVIGSDGFGYERRSDGRLQKFLHLGGVDIEDDVEIGSNTSIDRGSLGMTRLRRGCKIDNQIHVAHNVDVGEDAVVIAQSMLGGSVKVGARAWLAPAAVLMNQVAVGDDALVGLGAVVTKSVPEGQTVMGAPAAPEEEFRAMRSAIKKLMKGGAELG